MALPSLILITLVVATGAILLAAADPPQLCDAAGQPDDLVKKLCQLRTAANQLSNDITAVLIETELAEAETLESPDKRKNEFMRFGKRKNEFMRFGKRKNEFMRFGKRKNEFMRFGKRDEDTLKELEAVEH